MIRLSKEFCFEGKEVEIFRRDEVILREKPVKVLAQMPKDFYAETRVDEPA